MTEFCLQQGTFDAVRDAALALKSLGRWDLVLHACMNCFSHVKKCDPTLVVKPLKKEDDFPFRWMFPADGLKMLTPPQLALLAKTRTTLFLELRRVLTGLVTKKMTRQEYAKRLQEIVNKYAHPLYDCAAVFEVGQKLFCDNSVVLGKVEQAAQICHDIIHALLADRPNLVFDMLVKQIEQLIEFKRALITRTTKQRKRVRVEDDDDDAEESEPTK